MGGKKTRGGGVKWRCDGNDVTIACNMQRAVAEAVAAIVNQRIRLRGGEQVRAPR